MMTLDYVGDGEAMEYAQLGQQPLVRTTATSPEPRRLRRRGTFRKLDAALVWSCLNLSPHISDICGATLCVS